MKIYFAHFCRVLAFLFMVFFQVVVAELLFVVNFLGNFFFVFKDFQANLQRHTSINSKYCLVL